MKRAGVLYFALGVTTVLGVGAVTNQIMPAAPMSISLGNDRIIFPDGTEQTTAAGGISSSWVVPDTYTKVTVSGRDEFTAIISAPEVTQEVLDSGSVLVYAQLEGYTTQIWPTDEVGLLPITLMYDFYGLQIDNWSARMTPGAIQIIFKNSDDLYSTVDTNHSFRYVVIPGG